MGAQRNSPVPDIVMNQATFRTSWSLLPFAEACARAGMTRVSIWGDTVAATGTAQSKQLLRDVGLNVFGWNRAGPLLASDASERATLLATASNQVRLAAEFGAEHIIAFTGGLLNGQVNLQDGRAQAEDAISTLSGVAKDAGVALAVEPLHPMLLGDRTVLATMGAANDLCELIGSGLGVVIDSHHVWWDTSLKAELNRAQGRIRGFHVNDWLIPMPHPLNGRGMMGDGIIDLAGMWRDVQSAGYSGPIEVEIFSDYWWSQPPDDVLALALKRCGQIFGSAS
ncbi:MAG: sugar phosphate isomerase/epimerase [Akkermansiaceae bacterium]|jgi:sugar phosphate isomerase/epimerase